MTEEKVEIYRPISVLDAEYVRCLLGTRAIQCFFTDTEEGTIILVVQSEVDEARRLLRTIGREVEVTDSGNAG